MKEQQKFVNIMTVKLFFGYQVLLQSIIDKINSLLNFY